MNAMILILLIPSRQICSYSLSKGKSLGLNRCFSRFLSTSSIEEHDLWTTWDFGSKRKSDEMIFKQYVNSLVPDLVNDLNSDQTTHGSVKQNKPEKFDELWSFLSNEEIEKGISILSEYCSQERKKRFREVIENRTSKIRMLFENPSNINNVWAALRTFDSFGIQNIDVVMESFVKSVSSKVEGINDINQKIHSPNDLIKKLDTDTKRRHTMYNAMGSQKWLTISQHSSVVSCLSSLKESGYTIFASDIHQSSISFSEIDWSLYQKSVIVMGNEEIGISESVRQIADHRFYIPMKGFAESFNLSVACAILCSVLEMKGVLQPNLPKDVQNRILLTWLARTAPGSLLLLKRHGLPLQQIKSLYNTILGFSTKP